MKNLEELAKEAKQKAEFSEIIIVPLGFPKGILHNLDMLRNYCNSNHFDFAQVREGDYYVALTRFGKGTQKIIYDKQGNYEGMSSAFDVETNGQQLPTRFGERK